MGKSHKEVWRDILRQELDIHQEATIRVNAYQLRLLLEDAEKVNDKGNEEVRQIIKGHVEDLFCGRQK
ncbi:MAG: hypothetical protein KAS32_04640 [Candidatus Peribacteraceae bacterium]|nr:hypothetical protein [Candidatus Peribacteraceae bacterium]